MKGVLFCQYVLPASMLALLLFLTSLWLPQGTVQNCELSWLPCLSISSLTKEAESESRSSAPLDSAAAVLGECPGQSFQVSRLLHHLNSALDSAPDHAPDLLLEPYLLCWEELIKFMEALGPLVGFISGKVQERIALIRRLCDEYAGPTHDPAPDSACVSVGSLLEAELQRGAVDFHGDTPSASRTLLRLHRALLWLQLLLEKVGVAGEGRSLGQLCTEAYAQALERYHPWFLRRVARLAFAAMPDISTLLDAVCVSSLEQARPIMRTVVMAITEVRRRTHTQLEQRDMLDLP